MPGVRSVGVPVVCVTEVPAASMVIVDVILMLEGGVPTHRAVFVAVIGVAPVAVLTTEDAIEACALDRGTRHCGTSPSGEPRPPVGD